MIIKPSVSTMKHWVSIVEAPLLEPNCPCSLPPTLFHSLSDIIEPSTIIKPLPTLCYCSPRTRAEQINQMCYLLMSKMLLEGAVHLLFLCTKASVSSGDGRERSHSATKLSEHHGKECSVFKGKGTRWFDWLCPPPAGLRKECIQRKALRSVVTQMCLCIPLCYLCFTRPSADL